ncbi:MAG TPA: hypothetical protein VLD65_07550 [Anaerolineales bacterium]|nr:hypothetical protein [Anaerolineales bacterium]
MIPQILTGSLSLFYLVGTCQFSNSLSIQPYLATSLDYGFDFDEDELASELSAPLPASLADQPVHPLEADEFERLYHWFNG